MKILIARSEGVRLKKYSFNLTSLHHLLLYADTPAEKLAEGLLSVVNPSIEQLSSRLLELQETQAALVETVKRNNTDLIENSTEWKEAKAILERIPEYVAKVSRIRKTEIATQQLLAKIEKSTGALRTKLEEKEREKINKKSSDAAAFGSVSKQ